MKRYILLALALSAALSAQVVQRFAATTGDVSLSGTATTATVQQLATPLGNIALDQVVVYCSVACSVTQAANGTAATATAGTVTPILPTPLLTPAPVTFWTASNVGTGTAQGGITHVPAGGTVVLCLNTACGNPTTVSLGSGSGTAMNYSVTVASITGTANITFYLRSID